MTAAELHVLLVEDSAADAALLVRELERGGFRVSATRVDSAAKLADALPSRSWDIVFSDFTLPGFSGLAALDTVKQHDPDVPFIFVSGTIGEDRAVEAMHDGANDYILKNNLTRLTAAVRRELRESQNRRERHRAEERLRALFDSALDAVVTMDAAGTITGWNAQAERTFGWTAAEATGRILGDLLIPPQYREAHRRGVAEFLATGAGPILGKRIEITALRRDGREFPVELTVNAARLGEDWLFSAFLRDITERRQLEHQLRQSQKMEAVGLLAGGVAHDFNNILTAIFGYTDMLAEDLPPDSPGRADVKDIRTAAERAAALTRQLLAFSRQQVLEPVVLSPNALLQDFDKMLRRIISEDVVLTLALAGDVGNIRADAGQLEQVIMNLAVNARDAMPQGGKLLIETGNAELSEQYAELHQPVIPGQYVMIAVTDTGTGMTADVKARVFEPFFTTKQKGKGTGLGLSTVYGIVKQSDGYIWVYSEPGRGTTFKIYLPRVDARPHRASSPRIHAILEGTETILLAEDDAMLRPLAAGLLTKLGYTVLAAEHSGEAVNVALHHRGPIHLLVTDVVMPGGSGRELARTLAEQRPDMKVLYISGYTDDAIVRHGMLEPGLSFLQKPFTPAVLARKVRDVLDAS